jgi:hypothetical protein
VNDVPPIVRATTPALSVAVIAVDDARPAGACADTSAEFEAAGFVGCPCLSIVQVSPPPATEDNVAAASNQPTDTIMNPPAATAPVVVNAIVVEDGSAPAFPRSATLTAIATGYGKLTGCPVSSIAFPDCVSSEQSVENPNALQGYAALTT